MKILLATVALYLLAGCGAGNPDFSSPADQQVFTISQQQSTAFPITLADPTLTDTTIEVRIPKGLAGRLNCSMAGPNGNCFIANNPNQQMTRTCSETLPCEDNVAIIARRGDRQRAITITIRDVGYAAQK